MVRSSLQLLLLPGYVHVSLRRVPAAAWVFDKYTPHPINPSNISYRQRGGNTLHLRAEEDNEHLAGSRPEGLFVTPRSK